LDIILIHKKNTPSVTERDGRRVQDQCSAAFGDISPIQKTGWGRRIFSRQDLESKSDVRTPPLSPNAMNAACRIIAVPRSATSPPSKGRDGEEELFQAGS